jgi:hypothetical protein
MPIFSAALLLATTLAVQEPESSRRIQETAATARNVARDVGLPTWGLLMIEKDRPLAKSDQDKAELELATCDVLRYQAERLRDPVLKLAALTAAGGSYSRLLETFGSTEVAQRAQSQVGLTAFYYAAALDQLFATEIVSEERRKQLIADAEPFFKSAIKAMNALIIWWEALPDEAEEKEGTRHSIYYPTQFYRGIIYTSWARLYPQDSLERDQYSSKALEFLNEFALSSSGPYAMTAYKLAADVNALRGEYATAFEYYEYVIGTCRELIANPVDPDGNAIDAFLLRLFEAAVMDATLGKIQVLVEQGRSQDAQATIADFDRWLKAENIVLQDGGSRIRLLAARDLVDQGRIGEALTIAQQIADDNQRSVLRLQATAVMAYAIQRAPPDAEIPLDTLFQAAEGSQQAGEFDRAIPFWRALIARLPGTPKESEYLSRAYLSLASCWHQLGEGLLAGCAAQAGFNSGFSDAALGLNLAKQWYAKSEGIFRSRPGDAVLKQWNDEAFEAINSIVGEGDGDSPDAILYRGASNKRQQADTLAQAAKGKQADSAEAKAACAGYREAERAFAKLNSASKFYERASVQRGICMNVIIRWDAGAGDEAIQIFREYLATIADPSHAPKDAAERKYRKESEPTALYYLGDSWRQLAKAGRSGAWEEMIRSFDGYADRYQAEQRDLADSTRDARIEAYLALSKTAEAEKEFQNLLTSQPKDARIVATSWKLQNYFTGLADKAKADGAAVREPLLRKAADYLGLMNQRSPAPSGDSLYREAKMRIELREWSKSESLLKQALNDAATPVTAAYRFGAESDLVDTLLQQHRVGEALPIVEELDKEAPTEPRVLKFKVMVLAGFLIVENDQVLEVPGDGKADSLQRAFEASQTLLQVEENRALEANESKFRWKAWWEARTNQIYVVYRMGQTDPAQAGTARKIVEGLAAQAPDLGEATCGPEVPLKLRWILQR